MNVSSNVDEIEQIVKDWYVNLGQQIPDIEISFLKAYRDQELAEKTIIWDGPLPDSDVSIHPPPKPVYGTPEFWKDWWARKKAKEKVAAERAAAGLPELVEEKAKKPRKKKT
jgi:hypothetical protein